MDSVLLSLALLTASHVEVGPSSMYRPGDGHNAGRLACGGKFTEEQVHIAYRKWPVLGCRRAVLVYSYATGRIAAARVMDGGPYGITDGKGRWRTWTRSYTPPAGWRFRGMLDMSYGLWRRLGKPGFLSKVKLLVVPEKTWRAVRAVLNAFRRGRSRPVATSTPALRRWRGELAGAGGVLETDAHPVEKRRLRRDLRHRPNAVFVYTERLRELGRPQPQRAHVPEKIPSDPTASARLGVRESLNRFRHQQALFKYCSRHYNTAQAPGKIVQSLQPV